MFRQEINLYKSFESSPPTQSFLTWKLFLAGNALFFCLLVFIYLFGTLQVQSLVSQQTTLTIQVATLQKKFFTLKSTYPALFFSEDANQSIDQLKKSIGASEQVLKNMTNHTAFSQILTTFAEAIAPNVWLTEITIKQGGNDISLQGHSLNMEFLQTFLSALAKQPFFSNFNMNMDNIENVDKKLVGDNLIFAIELVKNTDENILNRV